MTAPAAQEVTTVGSLCSGYEGIGLAVEAVVGQVEYLWHADNDEGATKVLETRFPGVPNLDDISKVDWSTVKTPDILVTGFPCTDLSLAGRGDGLIGDVTIPAGTEDCGCRWADHGPDTCRRYGYEVVGVLARAGFYDDAVRVDDFEDDVTLAELAAVDPEAAARAVAALNDEDREGPGPKPERTIDGTGNRSGVWQHVYAAISALRPGMVVIENVPGILSVKADRGVAPGDPYVEAAGDDALRALGRVLGDLAEAGFDAEWITVAASEVGAVHRRLRVFILAWPQEAGAPERFAARVVQLAGGTGGTGGHAADAEGDPWRLGHGDSVPAADAEGLGHRNPGTAGIGGLPSATVRGAVEAVELLPTPAAARSGRQRSASAGAAIRPSLDSITDLLPTPMAADGDRTSATMPRGNPTLVGALLPTPRATDGTNGGPNQRGSSGDLMLTSAVMLMPTPTASQGRNATANRTAPKPTTWTESWTLNDVAYADKFGQYAPAIRLWEQVIGRPAPDPTEIGSKGQRRLAARFVEWMMGLPDGWVTAVPGLKRNDQLRILGNGVVWLQAAYALRILLARATEVRSDLVGAAR